LAIPQQASGKSYNIASLTLNENSAPPAVIGLPTLQSTAAALGLKLLSF